MTILSYEREIKFDISILEALLISNFMHLYQKLDDAILHLKKQVICK